MNRQLKLLRVGNHWYPCINHELGYPCSLCDKLDRYLNLIDFTKSGELIIELEEIGIVFEGINIIYFNEQDIFRYLSTDDEFDLRLIVNNHEFTISSYLYFLLEDQFNLNFHKESYKIHIY